MSNVLCGEPVGRSCGTRPPLGPVSDTDGLQYLFVIRDVLPGRSVQFKLGGYFLNLRRLIFHDRGEICNLVLQLRNCVRLVL